MSDQHAGRPAPDVVAAGVPAIEEIPEEVILTGDVGSTESPPGDRPMGVTERQVTPAGQRRPETLEERMRREQRSDTRGGRVVPRQLYEPGADEDGIDDEAAMIADEDAIVEGTLSAEEAAMRVVESPPGASLDDDPGYLSKE
jgi:hypothetical protein